MRGARVRVLLDSLFDDVEDPRGNRATTDYLNELAAVVGLDLAARLGNPTGGVQPAKLALVRVGPESWSALGGLNGGEISHKLNREVMLLIDMPDICARLVKVFVLTGIDRINNLQLRRDNGNFTAQYPTTGNRPATLGHNQRLWSERHLPHTPH